MKPHGDDNAVTRQQPRMWKQEALTRSAFVLYFCTVVNWTDGPVTSRLLKKRPVFCRVWPSHASHLSILTELH